VRDAAESAEGALQSDKQRRAPQPTGPEGALVVVNIVDYRYVSIGARVAFGIMTGNAFITEPERLCRAICPFGKGRVPIETDSIGPGMLERSLREYVEHRHQERNHQGVGNRLITPTSTRHDVAQTIVRRPRLGGILNFYQRAAA
jgi:hypothetical protein